MKNVVIIAHPLIDHSMTILRDKNTKTEEFRRHADIVAKVLIDEAAKRLQTEPKKIDTPLAPFSGQRLKSNSVAIPILRAGLSMTNAMYEVLPNTSVGFIGLERDEKTAIAKQYYGKLPKISADTVVFLLDPMLATGGSMDAALDIIKKAGGKTILAVTVVCAPEGLKRVNDKHPDVEIITAAVDSHLDKNAYIVPGLGDFGDRYFGTEKLATD